MSISLRKDKITERRAWFSRLLRYPAGKRSGLYYQLWSSDGVNVTGQRWDATRTGL